MTNLFDAPIIGLVKHGKVKQETIVVTSRFKQVQTIQWTKTSCGLI